MSVEVKAPGATGAQPTEATSPSTPQATPPAAAARGRKGLIKLNRRVLIVVGVVLLAVAGTLAYSTYRDSLLFVSTENAQIGGTPIQVGSMNAGRVDSIVCSVGVSVHKGDVVARVALPSQIGTAQNGQPKLGFLGSGDTHVDVHAPVDGIVIGVPVAVGATVAAGQAIVQIIDPAQLWVSANIDETAIDRVRVGQSVSVHIDTLNADVPGRVEAVTPATAATFSMLPSSTSSGTFNKVTQLVPIRISLNLGTQPTLVGSSVEVKIRVQD
jgi:multidrug resistance efflux pump